MQRSTQRDWFRRGACPVRGKSTRPVCILILKRPSTYIVKRDGVWYTDIKATQIFLRGSVLVIDKENSRTIAFWLGGMLFEYDEWKNEYNVEHHGISFTQAARVFFDYDRIE